MFTGIRLRTQQVIDINAKLTGIDRVQCVFCIDKCTGFTFTLSSGNNLHIKGLVYSSHERVRVVNNAFGGLRNRIIYEVNVGFSEHGDEIKGSFYLVTNGGEREIPYSLRIQTGTGGEELASLKTARDFANLARKNIELALRLFEYQDFIQAPFMQEPEARSIYEGLRGRNGRKNLLEEFLVALHVKEPVRISTDTSPRCYRDLEEEKEDFIELALSGWGYKEAVLQAEGAFISLETSSVTDRDFTENRCQIPYRILPDALHGGKNMGRIVIRTPRREFVIPIEAERRKRRDPYRETAEDKKIVARENGRLIASLNAAKALGGTPVVFLHYPPAYDTAQCRELLDTMQTYGVKECYYGHIHGDHAAKKAPLGEYGGIKMHLVSCDYIRFTPKLVRKDAEIG